VKPYWTSDDGAIVVYHARCEDVIASVLPVREVALVHADPVYGIGDHAHRPGQQEGRPRKNTTGVAVGKARAWRPLRGNDRSYDPSSLLALDRPSVLWGANHYSDKVPGSPSWIVWDKRDGTAPDDGSDAELAWTNLGGALRTFRHAWRGLARASETGTPHGPDLYAAVAMGLRVIACDVERWCCDTAIGRLGAVTPERAAQPVGPLFGGGS